MQLPKISRSFQINQPNWMLQLLLSTMTFQVKLITLTLKLLLLFQSKTVSLQILKPNCKLTIRRLENSRSHSTMLWMLGLNWKLQILLLQNNKKNLPDLLSKLLKQSTIIYRTKLLARLTMPKCWGTKFRSSKTKLLPEMSLKVSLKPPRDSRTRPLTSKPELTSRSLMH